jgi:hypothetical protein
MFRRTPERIIDRDRVMTTDPIFAEIEALLNGGAAEASVEELEHSLTAGYAAALQIEGERWRLERRIKHAAALLGDDAARTTAQEIAGLARRLSSADADLSRLRDMLGTLREQTAAARAA